jgi:hypothetical protein
MAASIFFLIPLSTYSVKDFLNNFMKLSSLLMLQKVFSMQMSSAVEAKINKKRQRGKKAFNRPVKMRKYDSATCFK